MERTYVDLQKIISFEDFDFDNWYNGERDLLQPRLEALGFTNIEWKHGEYDSFGPLSRVCKAKSSEGETIHFVYA